MILKISLRAKAGVAKTLVKQKRRLNFLYFPQNTLMLTESCGKFSDLHSIFRLRALRYWNLEMLDFQQEGQLEKPEKIPGSKASTNTTLNSRIIRAGIEPGPS